MAASDFYEVLDPRFGRLFNGNARVNKLYTGCQWAEGPAWFAAGRYLVWSDIPNNRMHALRRDRAAMSACFASRAATPTATPSTGRAGWSSCEHGGRRVSRTEFDGSIITIADSWQGKRFNSPNDVVVKSDGSIWFTDPAYGIDSDYEGDKADSEIGACHVYRVDPGNGEGRGRHHRHGAAERHRLLARRIEALCRRHRRARMARTTPPHMRVFNVVPGGKKVERRQGLRRLHRRPVRRLPARRAGPHLDERRRRRALLRRRTAR